MPATDTTTQTTAKEKVKELIPPGNPIAITFGLLGVTLLSIAIYVGYDFVIVEQLTRDLVVIILNAIGIPAIKSARIFPVDDAYSMFTEATILTPAVELPTALGGHPTTPYWIVKACTGFQAGAILISLILFTPYPKKSLENITGNGMRAKLKDKNPTLYTFSHKTLVVMAFILILFLTNAARIAFHLALVQIGFSFEFAHDDLSKPIGFIGTIGFALAIEKMGIPIIDTFADWLDLAWYYISVTKRKVGL